MNLSIMPFLSLFVGFMLICLLSLTLLFVTLTVKQKT